VFAIPFAAAVAARRLELRGRPPPVVRLLMLLLALGARLLCHYPRLVLLHSLVLIRPAGLELVVASSGRRAQLVALWVPCSAFFAAVMVLNDANASGWRDGKPTAV
jgi:hypothetical protein